MTGGRGQRTVVAAAVFALVLAVGGSATAGTSGRVAADASTAKIVFVDVGQGDGVVIRVGGKFIVSDAGPPGKAAKVDAELDLLGANNHIDVAILSHGHLDHVGGFHKLVQDFGYNVDLVLASPNAKWNTSTNQAILNALKNEGGATITWVKRGDSFAFGGASWKILNPAQGTFTAASSVENSSLVYVLEVNGRRALLTGDLKEAATAQLAAVWGDRGRAHVFLVTHHGSGSGSSADVLAEITPRFAVISVGATNTFGHPAPATIARLRAQAVKTERIYCTATNGMARATITTSGSISWQTTGQSAPWWSRSGGERGSCAGQ